MKKLFIAAIVFLAYSQVEAQVSFRPGVRAGVNFSHFTKGDYENVYFYQDPNTGNFSTIPNNEFNSKTDFYVGIYGALRLTKYYTLQPEVTYSRQGSKAVIYNQPNGILTKSSTQIDLSYISVAIINKFTFSDKLNMHIGPTIDVLAEQNGFGNNYSPYYNGNYYYNDYYGGATDIDLAFVFGLGYNFTKNLGIEARVKKGVIPVDDDFDGNHTNVVFSAGLTYTFDLTGAGTTVK